MRCHQHIDSEAVAVCVSCGRALCRDCQQPTLDQRMLCGLPQCSEFAKRQAVVPFILQQDCANRATAYRTMIAMFRSLGMIGMVPGVLLVVTTLMWMGLNPMSTSIATFLSAAAVGIFLTLLGAVAWRLQGQLSLVQRNCEDMASEFGQVTRGNIAARAAPDHGSSTERLADVIEG